MFWTKSKVMMYKIHVVKPFLLIVYKQSLLKKTVNVNIMKKIVNFALF